MKKLRRRNPTKSSLILFSISGCPACVEIKKVLKEEKVKYRNINSSKNTGLVKKLGISKVPVLYIKSGKDYFEVGKNVKAAKEALEASKQAYGSKRRNPRSRKYAHSHGMHNHLKNIRQKIRGLLRRHKYLRRK